MGLRHMSGCMPHEQRGTSDKVKEFINGFRPRYIPGEDIVGRAYEWRGEKVIMRNAEIIATSRLREKS